MRVIRPARPAVCCSSHFVYCCNNLNIIAVLFLPHWHELLFFVLLFDFLNLFLPISDIELSSPILPFIKLFWIIYIYFIHPFGVDSNVIWYFLLVVSTFVAFHSFDWRMERQWQVGQCWRSYLARILQSSRQGQEPTFHSNREYTIPTILDEKLFSTVRHVRLVSLTARPSSNLCMAEISPLSTEAFHFWQFLRTKIKLCGWLLDYCFWSIIYMYMLHMYRRRWLVNYPRDVSWRFWI